jgi:antitoxin (DNA-binding transcriptional repressor) of toxin-antitoxin stability system
MKKLNLHEVKAQLSKYIEMVEAGETVIICKRNVPVAEMRPIPRKRKKAPELGWAEGTFTVPADFNEMAAEELTPWEGDESDPLREFRPKPSRE